MTDRTLIRAIVRGAYDAQKLRIETGNRLVANFRAKLGLNTEADDTEATNVLKELERRFRLITDGVASITRKRSFAFDGVISSYAELSFVAHYLELKTVEARIFRDLERALEGFPIYEAFLKGVKGCGPAMSGVIISEVDIHAARYVSSLWAYAGLDVASDGRGRSRKAEHLVQRAYVNKDGEQAERRGITFNPFLKTKLMGVLAGSFLKCNSPYRDAYDNYKHRIETDPRHEQKTKGHRHNMSMRYMVKAFLRDLYAEWRTLEGLPVAPDYHEAKQDHVHGDPA